MGRTHTWANVAPALKTLLAQYNDAYPVRDKSSDGIWPSAAHTAQNPNSDHEWGNALDIDNELAKDVTVTKADAKRLSLDPRCKYTIHEDVIYYDGVGRDYGGSNPHTGHIHISVHEAKRDDASPWDFGLVTQVEPYYYVLIAAEGTPVLCHGNDVKSKAVEAEALRRGLGRPYGRFPAPQSGYKFIRPNGVPIASEAAESFEKWCIGQGIMALANGVFGALDAESAEKVIKYDQIAAIVAS